MTFSLLPETDVGLLLFPVANTRNYVYNERNFRKGVFPMIRDFVKKYYIDQNCNCAESVFLAANEALTLGLTKEDAKLISGFGGGIGCGSVCGALAGSVAILGKVCIGESAHKTPGFKEKQTELKSKFEEKLGSILCCEIKPKFFNETDRCLATVLAAADVLDEVLADVKK